MCSLDVRQVDAVLIAQRIPVLFTLTIIAALFEYFALGAPPIHS